MILLSKISADNGIHSNALLLFILFVCSFGVANILIINSIYQMRKLTRDELVKQNVEYLMAYVENALNACVARDSTGPIQAHIRNVGNKTVIAVSNPCGPDLRLENGLPVARGIGIDSIISSIKYTGRSTMRYRTVFVPPV